MCDVVCVILQQDMLLQQIQVSREQMLAARDELAAASTTQDQNYDMWGRESVMWVWVCEGWELYRITGCRHPNISDSTVFHSHIHSHMHARMHTHIHILCLCMHVLTPYTPWQTCTLNLLLMQVSCLIYVALWVIKHLSTCPVFHSLSSISSVCSLLPSLCVVGLQLSSSKVQKRGGRRVNSSSHKKLRRTPPVSAPTNLAWYIAPYIYPFINTAVILESCLSERYKWECMV